jgi:ketosteroid isomerase-like protein
MAPDPSVSKAILKAFLDAFNRHDLDAIMSFFADDCVFDAPRGPQRWGRRYVGPDAVREGLGARFTGIPDVHYGEDRHWLAGDRGVSEWRLTGTTTSGVRIDVMGCDLFEFRRGKIVE